ncbi:MAG: hypothetical protein F9K24_12650 [Leptonema illini]|uniref:Lipoprotein n=1 Tax=Leptonema illini TaxID=183 RepID=A0A833LWN3_9LEPT|nr:MAG: hypothetical protein F9K24_12650 [Leptonema illini]
MKRKWILVLLPMLVTLSCRSNDIFQDEYVTINAEKLQKLKPGQTEQSVRELFDNAFFRQITFENRPLPKRYQGKDYLIDRILVFRDLRSKTEKPSENVTVYGWTDRISLTVFLSYGKLQFFTVSHQHWNESGQLVKGVLHNPVDSDDTWPGLQCDMSFFQIFELGRKVNENDRRECGPLLGDL